MGNVQALILSAQTDFHAGAFDSAENNALRALELSADNTEAMTILGGVELWRQNFEAAAAWFARVLETSPDNRAFVGNLLLALWPLSNQKVASGDAKGGLEIVRRMLSLDLEDLDARNSLLRLLSQTGEKARLTDFVRPEAIASMTGKVVFIACFPKSGSTYLNRLFQEITGFDYGHGVEYYMDNEQDLSYRKIADAARANCVMQHHTRATQVNIRILQGFGIRPVILVRNLYDMVFSVHDFMLKGGARGAVFGFPEQFGSLDEARRLDYVIDMVMPWYVGFYVSWFNAQRRGDVELHWLRYEDLVSQPVAELQRAMDFLGLAVFDGVIEQAVERVNQNRDQTRFNKGVVGRGQALTLAQRQRLKNLAAFFPDVDFGMILSPEPPPPQEKPLPGASPTPRPLYSRFF